MDALAENKTLHFRSFYLDKCDELSLDSSRQVLLSHFGVLSNELIMKLSDEFRVLLISKGVEKSLKRRIYSIMIEGLQSFMIHGSIEKTSGKQLCFLIISESEGQFEIILGNVIEKKENDYIEQYLLKLNDESNSELAERFKSSLEGTFLENGGSGLGFINARIKSNNPIGAMFSAINEEQVLMELNIRVDK